MIKKDIINDKIWGEFVYNIAKEYIDLYKSGEIKVLFNFGVLTHGFDAPNTDIVIIARPTQSPILYSQMIGRVMRGVKSGGNKNCKVITVKDPIYGFRDMSESFKYWEELWD